MKPESPKVKGKNPETKVPPNWEDRPDSYERFDNAVKKVFSVPREALTKPSKPKRQPKRKAA